MEKDIRGPKNLAFFSERVTAFLTSRNGLHVPPEEITVLNDSQSPYNSFFAFENQLPSNDVDIRHSFIRHEHDPTTNESLLEAELVPKDNLLQTILLPASLICISIALLAGALLALVCFYKIVLVSNLFQPEDEKVRGPGFVLVNFSASE